MKNIFRTFGISILIVFLSITLILPVKANSAITVYTGSDQSSVFTSDKDCPIQVVNENLTFSINDISQSNFMSEDYYRDYSNRVTAEYQFYNPSDLTIEATLYFPFVRIPGYTPVKFIEESLINREKYSVQINGENIDQEIRCSYYPYAEFQLERSIAMLSDEYLDDEFYKKDLKVTKYLIHINDDLSRITSGSNIITFYLKDASSRYLVNFETSVMRNADATELSAYISDKYENYLYIFGDASLPQYRLFDRRDNKEIECSTEVRPVEEMTFEQFVLLEFDQQNRISKTDYYNAQLSYIRENTNGEVLGYFDGSFTDSLMYWYKYKIKMEPHKTITNTVTALIYPTVDAGKEPPVYEYTYLLSPAQTWSSFKNLTISINTDMYLQSSNFSGFSEKTDGCYRLFSETLPEKDLTFSLCQLEHPKNKNSSYGWLYLLVFISPIIAIFLFVLLLILVIRKARKKYRGF